MVRILELFLLNQGIEPEFYESEYGMYWEDAMFGNEELNAFAPDMIYIHTSLSQSEELSGAVRFQRSGGGEACGRIRAF